MTEGIEFAVRSVFIGIGATVLLDLWNAILKRLFGVPSLSMRMLGRWAGHLPRRHFVHVSIAAASPVRGERVIGWCAHYLIGVTFAALLLAIWGLEWARNPTPVPALIVSLVTLAAPFFILQPGMGAGIAASRTPKPNLARLKSTVSHVVYGIGLYASAYLLTLLIRS